jgi:RNA polymerase sigma-70 factor (ECF subfamily)
MKVNEESLVANRSGLLRKAYGIVGYADAEDVVQDAFERAWRATSLRANTDPRLWLNRIARNVAFDVLRKRARTIELYGPRLEVESAEAAAVRRENTTMVGTALSKLPRDQRRAIVLHDIGGYSSREIAKLDGVAHNTVRTRLFRARRTLRQVLHHSRPQMPNSGL